MRVLIYVEPHPIRNQPTHFAAVARRFIRLAATAKDVDVRIYGNPATLDVIATERPEETKGRLLRPLPSEAALFAAQEGEWTERRIATWCELMAGEGIAERYLDVIRGIWSRFPFDVVVYWGENGAVRSFARDMPVAAIAMELGFTRPPYPDSLVMDPFGTSGGSMMARMTAAELAEAVGGVGLSSAEALFCSGAAGSDAWESAHAPLPARLRDALLGRRRRIAVFPLQLADDANLLRHSPYGSLVEAVRDVVPRLADAGYVTIVKEHPAARFRPQTLIDNAEARSAVREFGDAVLWLGAEEKGIANAQLLALADLVVTINSSVGFEALLHDRTVTVLGEAAYKPAGVFPDLDAAIAGDFDRGAYRTAIAHLRRFSLDAYLLPPAICDDVSACVRQLALLAGIARDGAGPAEAARRLFEATARTREARRRSLALEGPWGGGRDAPAGTAPKVAGERKIPGLWDSRLADELASALWRISGVSGAEGLEAWLDEAWAENGTRARLLGRLALIDPEHYLRLYPDVAKAGMDPLTHFVIAGEGEARSPRQQIDLSAYRSERGEEDPGRLLLAMLKEIALGDMRPRRPRSGSGRLTRPVPGVNERTPVQEIVRRLRLVARQAHKTDLLAWLDAARRDPARWRDTLVRSGLFDPSYYARANPDVTEAGVDVVQHFVAHGQWEGRPPGPHVSVQPFATMPRNEGEPAAALLAALVEAVEWKEEEFFRPLDAEEEALAAQTREALAALARRKPRRIAVVAHCYYADVVPEILAVVKAMPEPCDLIVTLPAWGARRIRQAVREAVPDAVLCPVPNRGKDVGAFLAVLPTLVARNYTAVLKIHTKKGYRFQRPQVPALGDAWRRHAFDALAGSPATVKAVVEAFAATPRLSIVGPARLLVTVRDYPALGMPVWYWKLFGLEGPEPSDVFFAGSMFWVRPSAIRALVSPGLSLDAFAPDDGAGNGTLAHDVERLFASVCNHGRGRIGAVERVGDGARVILDAPPSETPLSETIARLADVGRTAEGALIW